MKQFALLVTIVLFATNAFAQKEKPLKELAQDRKANLLIADTMHFPSPMEFRYVDTINLSKSDLYRRCLQWISTIMDNAKRNIQIEDSLAGKIVLTHVQSGAFETFENITIDVKDGKYRVLFDGYSSINVRNNEVPIESLKDTKYLRLDKMYIMQHNDAVVKSLQDYLKKNDDF